MRCRFCGCTELTPCQIPEGLFDREGEPLTRCAWWLNSSCDAPPCVEKAYQEACAAVMEAQGYIEAGLVL